VLGAGGIGKTTLALAAAHGRRTAQRDGAAWVDLSSIAQTALVTAAVAQALHLPVGPGENPTPALIAGLKTLQVLLVLDNAEHLVDAVARLADAIAAGAPDVRLLVTSQVALKVEHERVFRLGPLSVPETGTGAYEAMSHGAVALFADCAQAAERRFELTDDNVGTVIDLCRHLDGLALAIKLAAGRLRLFGLHGLEQRLAERLKLIAGTSRSAPTRQQTLRAALDWSYGLLTPGEQATFRRLGVFAGGFTLELASAVAGDEEHDEWAVIEQLAALVDHSLVSTDTAEPPRYRLLEVAREYALERLAEQGELQVSHERHARAMLALFERSRTMWYTTSDAVLLEAWSRELDNVRGAIDWSTNRDSLLALDLVGHAGRLYSLLDLHYELWRRCALLEGAVGPDVPATIAARYWLSRSWSHRSSYARAREFAIKSITLYRAIGDELGLFSALCALGNSGSASTEEWRDASAELNSLDQGQWPPRFRAMRPFAEALMHLADGHWAAARDAAEASIALARLAGANRLVMYNQMWKMMAEANLGQMDEAVAACRDLIAQSGRSQSGVLDIAWGFYAAVLLRQGSVKEARDALVSMFAQFRRSEWARLGQFVNVYPRLAIREGRLEAAAKLVGYAIMSARRSGSIRWVGMEPSLVGLTEALEAVLDSQTLQRLMAEGETLDEEAVCALTLEESPPA